VASFLLNVNVDCADPYRLAEFWCAVTGRPMDPELSPDDEETWVEMPSLPNLYFQRVPEPKVVKNRVHVCLVPDVLRDEEADRLVGLGATRVGDYRTSDGRGWWVLADPEGNEFCVLRSNAERVATGDHEV
jgi:hypothetical protein